MTGDQTQNRVEPGTNEFYIFCCFFFFQLNLESSEILVLILLCHTHGSLIWFELEEEEKNSMCIKLNLYFFYKNIVYQYLLAYIDIA